MRRGFALLLPLLAGCGGVPDSEKSTAQADRVDAPATRPVLSGAGIAFTSSGSVEQSFEFGASAQEVAGTAARRIGDVAKHSENAECPAGPMSFLETGGLTLNFQDGRFVGWSTSSAEFIPWKTRRDVEAAGRFSMLPGSTLGEEFAFGDETPIYGIFDGKGPEAAVSIVWAGTNCLFR